LKPKNVMKMILCVLMVAVISGCSLTSKEADQALAKLDDKKETTIRVMYYDEQYFMQRFGNLFMAKYPNINIEVVSTRNMYNMPDADPKTMFAKFIEMEKPDVVLLNPGEIERLVGEQLLYDLEPVIAQDKFDIENIQPTIIDYLKMKGGGKLYGLSPTFFNEALLINRDLFTKQGVQVPEGKLKWEDVLLLAQRFSASQDSSERVYGFSDGMNRSDPYSLMMRIADSSGLTLENEGKSALLTPSWKQLVEQVVAVYKSGSIAREQNMDMGTTFTQEDWLLSDPFIAGKSAMTVANSYQLGSLFQAERILKDRSLNWEILNAPTGDQADQSTNFSLNEIFAIYSKSPNVRAAWEFIKYINSDEIARVYSKTPNELWSRTSYMTLKDGKSLEPFYELTFNRNETSEHDDYYSARYQLNEIANKEIEEVIADKQSIDQALEAIDKQLQMILDQLKTAKDTPAKP